jgi:hypothetical protein
MPARLKRARKPSAKAKVVDEARARAATVATKVGQLHRTIAFVKGLSLKQAKQSSSIKLPAIPVNPLVSNTIPNPAPTVKPVVSNLAPVIQAPPPPPPPVVDILSSLVIKALAFNVDL